MSSNQEFSDSELLGHAELFRQLNRDIAAGDGMVTSGKRHYFAVGLSAFCAIDDALRTARIQAKTIRHVLDYACGYGRVLRWLVAGFPHAKVIGADADSKAAKAASKTIGVETWQVDTALTKPFSQPFDLIWVGSLFTHLPRSEMIRVLSYLRNQITPKGILVFTTHGPLVYQRLKQRSRLYNLTETAARRVVSEYEATGYGYADYKDASNYGISIGSAHVVMAMASHTLLRPILYKERGWADHQDVYACLL